MAEVGGSGSFGLVRETASRPLRIFAFDPWVDSFTNPIVAMVPFEQVAPGPAGRLVEVVDYDRGSHRVLRPLDLNDRSVLLNQGLDPSESDRRFHQQMVYAVTMKVLTAFETGLGRPIIWPDGRRLVLVPHAPVLSNAHFDPELGAVLFGEMRGARVDNATSVVGSSVYTCLSFDVIAHEVVHAAVRPDRPHDFDDGTSPAAPETEAFHEGFADLIALLSRCSEKVVCARVIRDVGLDLKEHDHLFEIATQFGAAMGSEHGVRRYPTDLPKPGTEVDPGAGRSIHEHGQVLGSAFIDGFVEAFAAENRDLVRMAGDAVDRALHPDLVDRLADRAAGLASELRRAVIAAIDYLPPVGVRFGDFLRAFVTVDRLLFGADHFMLRAAIISSFHARGILPPEAGSLAEQSIAWPEPDRGASAVQIPHAEDALMLTAEALEWRRYHTVDPVRAGAVGEALVAQHGAPLARWRREIAATAREHARVLGLDPDRRVEVPRVAGSYVHDRQGDLHARVVVHLTQRSARSSAPSPARAGTTVICDSDGSILLLIPPPARRRSATSRVPHDELTDRQREIIDGLRNGYDR